MCIYIIILYLTRIYNLLYTSSPTCYTYSYSVHRVLVCINRYYIYHTLYSIQYLYIEMLDPVCRENKTTILISTHERMRPQS